MPDGQGDREAAEAVAQAQGSRAPIARRADRVSAVLVPVAATIAVGSGPAWMAVDPSATGVAADIALLRGGIAGLPRRPWGGGCTAPSGS